MNHEDHIKWIEARIAALEDKLSNLNEELEELDVALRVARRALPPSEQSSEGTPRPEGIPTIFKMAESVLKEDEDAGGHGLKAREIVDRIRTRYWPGLAAKQIQPSLYGFAGTGRLHKTQAGRFKRIKKNEAPPSESDDASDSTGEAATSPNDSRKGTSSIFD